jgi:hypothetical protein
VAQGVSPEFKPQYRKKKKKKSCLFGKPIWFSVGYSQALFLGVLFTPFSLVFQHSL